MRSRGLIPALGSLPWLLVPPAPAGDPTGPWRSLALEGDDGQVSAVAVSSLQPGRILLSGSFGRVFLSDDFGQTWTPADAGLPRDVAFPVLAASGADPDVFFAGGTGGMFRTANGGVTWTRIPDPPFGPAPTALRPSPADPLELRAAVGTGAWKGIWRSTDSGTSWASASAGLSGAGAFDLVHDPADPSRLLAGTSGGVARSTDGGASWSFVLPGGAFHELDGSPGAPAILRARTSAGAIHESTDGGASWHAFPAPIATSMATSPTDPSNVFVATLLAGCAWTGYGYGSVLDRSTDGGGSWQRVHREQDCNPVRTTTMSLLAVDPHESSRVYASWSGQSFQRSDAGGAEGTFVKRIDGLHMVRVRHLRVGAGDRWFLRPTWISGVFASTDGGASWDLRRTAPDILRYEPQAFEVNRGVPDLLLEAGTETCWPPGPWCDIPILFSSRSTDGGTSWVPERIDAGDAPVAELIASSADGQVAYAWEWADELSRTDDGWQSFTRMPRTGFDPRDAVVDPTDAMRVFAATEDALPVRLTTDGGVTWAPRSDGLPRRALPVRILIDPSNPGHLLLAFRDHGAFTSTDGGASWRTVPLAPGVAPAAEGTGPSARREVALAVVRDAAWDVSAGGRRVFLATDRGVLIEGYGWATDGLGSLRTTSIDYSPVRQKLLVGTERFGAFVLDVPATGAPRAETPPPAAGSEGRGLEVWPNPFEQSLSIRFATGSDAATTRLAVFDLNGRRVATIVAGSGPGPHEVLWDGRREDGRRAAPGVYFLRLDSGGTRITQRVVKVRG